MLDDVEPVSSMYIWSGNSVIWPYLKSDAKDGGN